MVKVSGRVRKQVVAMGFTDCGLNDFRLDRYGGGLNSVYVWPRGSYYNLDRCNWLVDIDVPSESLLECRSGVEFDDLLAACTYAVMAAAGEQL